jgi:hypothetical protein
MMNRERMSHSSKHPGARSLRANEALRVKVVPFLGSEAAAPLACQGI